MMIKTRVLEGGLFGGNYTDEFIQREEDNVHYGVKVSEWVLTSVIYDNDFIKPFFNGTEWVESETQENINNSKAIIYKERINGYFSHMYIRALSSSMNKRSTDLNYLLGLREEYEDKYAVSNGTLTSGSNYIATKDSILGEMEDEFTEAYLDTRLPLYGLPVEGTHLEKMYAIIVFKYEYGLQAFNTFNAFIRRFRTKCNKWVDDNEFTKLDSAFNIVDTLPDTLSMNDAQTLYNQFNNI